MRLILGLVGALAFTGSAHAAFTITFDASPIGPVPQLFVATGEPGIAFVGTAPDFLEIATLPQGNGTPGLFLPGDDTGNFLVGFLDAPANYLSIDFGNDEADVTIDGDVAVIFALVGDAVVGTAFTPLNRNGLLDQTLVYSGAAFTSFAFAFGDATLANPVTGPGVRGIGASELVDNIVVDVVPAPVAVALFGLGAFALVAGRRR